MLTLLTHFLIGTKDALRYSTTIPGFRKKHLSCALLSAFIWLTICLFKYMFMPSISWLRIDARVENWLSNAFSALWVVPLMLTSKIVNTFWFMETAEFVYQATGRKKKAPGAKVSEGIADLIFALIVYVVFMIRLIANSSVLPGLGKFGGLRVLRAPCALMREEFGALCSTSVNSALYFLHVSLLHAWTAFEYKWYPMGIDVRSRLATVESRWGYFMGFGFPLAATTFFDPMTAGCAFGVLFPMSILAAHLAKSPEEETLFRLRIFGPTVFVADKVSATLFNWVLKKKPKPRPTIPAQPKVDTPLSHHSSNHVPRPRKLY